MPFDNVTSEPPSRRLDRHRLELLEIPNPRSIHNFAIFGENKGLWAASFSSKSLIFLACLH
jgi:hypothetical protein